MLKILTLFIFTVWFSLANASELEDETYEKGFISITKVNPSIIIDLKYTECDNFLQKPAPGYISKEALLTSEAASALNEVQEYLINKGFSLVVYDAYHPIKTYKSFKEWAENADQTMKEKYYPNIDKTALIPEGYIKNKLDHTRGSTVDVTIIPLNKKLKKPCTEKKLTYENTNPLVYNDDGTLNMGSSYDVFDPVAGHECELIDQNAKDNRATLKEAMENYGFIANDKVWWQYRLSREPYLDTNFDFDV